MKPKPKTPNTILLKAPKSLIARLDAWIVGTGRWCHGARHAELLLIIEEGVRAREKAGEQ